MSPLEIIGLVAAIGGPISGVVVAIIVDRRSKHSGRTATEVAMAEVEVSEKQAHNQEIAVIIDGFTASISGLRVDVADARAEAAAARADAAAARKDYQTLRERHDKLSESHEALKFQMEARTILEQEMLRHIVALEQEFPNPPGPPTRPQWKLPTRV